MSNRDLQSKINKFLDKKTQKYPEIDVSVEDLIR